MPLAKLDSFLMANNLDPCHAADDVQDHASATIAPERISVTFNKVKAVEPGRSRKKVRQCICPAKSPSNPMMIR